MNLRELLDYRGQHQAPNREDSAPLYDLTKIYPDDVYGPNAVQYYGDSTPLDSGTFSIVFSARNRPNMAVKIYRAVPKNISVEEQIRELEKLKAYIMKHGRLPSNADFPGVGPNVRNFDWIWEKIEKLKSLPPEEKETKVNINPGDWVTINRQYAVQHGESTLLGKYRILTKTVPARTLFTDSNSIHEWGV